LHTWATGDEDEGLHTVRVTGFNADWAPSDIEATLRDKFKACGNIESVRVERGTATVLFDTERAQVRCPRTPGPSTSARCNVIWLSRGVLLTFLVVFWSTSLCVGG
jgi:hypothetical protein